MRFNCEVVPLSVGQYGPFRDAVGTDREGQTIPFLTFTSTDGGDVLRATAAPDADLDGLSIMTPTLLSFELYSADGGKLKLRTHGAAHPDPLQAA